MKRGERKFDIFSGEIQEGAIWLEAVSGLARARMRMEEIAAEAPGRDALGRRAN